MEILESEKETPLVQRGYIAVRPCEPVVGHDECFEELGRIELLEEVFNEMLPPSTTVLEGQVGSAELLAACEEEDSVIIHFAEHPE